ncbi:hypothetical protein GCM10022402_03820 [Salinactinospora qingdaonensis]|uniref:Carbohydrate kinase PfkB domain-containing protein n=1 Tax=Salinactinospora qingdaonensis TaxID=702744 RepID=A0ABP7EYA1_9ACTN
MARSADVVLVGRDEAETLWATTTVDEIRGLLPDVAQLVVKDAEFGATGFEADARSHVASPQVEVIEPVGAGDAFAAGDLSGLLSGRSMVPRLCSGHLCAAMTLRCTGDTAPASGS